jgi:hypothetical protein
VVGRGEEVGDVGGEARVGELALAAAEAGEVEAQRGDALRGQRRREAGRGVGVLAAGEAVREQRVRARRAVRQVEPRGEAVPAAAREVEAFGAHPAVLLVSVFGSRRRGAPSSRAGGQAARANRSRATPRMSSLWPAGVAARRIIARSQPGQRSTAPSAPP